MNGKVQMKMALICMATLAAVSLLAKVNSGENIIADVRFDGSKVSALPAGRLSNGLKCPISQQDHKKTN